MLAAAECHGERAEDLEQRVPVDQLEPGSQAAPDRRDRARRDLDRDEELQQVLEELGERHLCLLTSDGSWQTMRNCARSVGVGCEAVAARGLGVRWRAATGAVHKGQDFGGVPVGDAALRAAVLYRLNSASSFAAASTDRQAVNASLTDKPRRPRFIELICIIPRSTECPAAMSCRAVLAAPSPCSTWPVVLSWMVSGSSPDSCWPIATIMCGSTDGAH